MIPNSWPDREFWLKYGLQLDMSERAYDEAWPDPHHYLDPATKPEQ